MAINRKIDVDSLTDEQIEAAIQKITDKMNKDLRTVVDQSNAMLNRYGLACRINLLVDTEENIEDTKKETA